MYPLIASSHQLFNSVFLLHACGWAYICALYSGQKSEHAKHRPDDLELGDLILAPEQI